MAARWIANIGEMSSPIRESGSGRGSVELAFVQYQPDVTNGTGANGGKPEITCEIGPFSVNQPFEGNPPTIASSGGARANTEHDCKLL